MESKLKALKVVDLKDILSTARLDVSGRKSDLIARILDNKAAQDAYNQRLSPATTVTNDTASAKLVVTDTTPEAPLQPEQSSIVDSSHAPAPPTRTTTTVPIADTDSEAEKRRKRAERFGLSPVEPQKSGSGATIAIEEAEKLKARAARFGIEPVTQPTAGQKRTSRDNVDADELERRRKRAERFGTK